MKLAVLSGGMMAAIPGLWLSSGTSADRLLINVGFPKSGTQSAYEMLKCNGVKASHWMCGGESTLGSTHCGACVYKWLGFIAEEKGSHGRVHDASALLHKVCGNYNAFLQLDLENTGSCLFPQLDNLETLLAFLPNADFVAFYRDADSWLNSVRHWNNMYERLLLWCPLYPRNDRGIIQWHERSIKILQNRSDRIRMYNITDASSWDRFYRDFAISEKCQGKHSHETKLGDPSIHNDTRKAAGVGRRKAI